MYKKILRKLINFIQWFFDKVLTAKQRKFIKNSLTEKQIQYLKNKFKISTAQARLREMESIRIRLRNLGFTERAYTDLTDMFLYSKDPQTRKLAAWELALWHANQYSKPDAQKCLEYLNEALQGEKDKESIRRAAILKAESLEMLDRIKEAKETLSSILESNPHSDLYFAFANLAETEEDKIQWINKAFQMYGISEIFLTATESKSAYDRLRVAKAIQSKSEPVKVTVIIPVYNAEDVIQTSLDSVLAQTWSNLEVLVVDDCSTDRTGEIIKEYTEKDSRVHLIKTKRNGGAYVARNYALKVASGEFVTINDADDWSHPGKIEKQVMYLLKKSKLIGCTSQQARTTNNLKFHRRGKPGEFLFSNMSSFMFRRKPVFDAVGYWDCVRFGADSEFIKRIQKVFGEKSVAELPTGPLSFQRQSDSSLTGNSAFGFPGFFMGARKEYREAQFHYHSTSDNLYYDFPQSTRPFAVPEPMWPVREEKQSDRRHFDVIIVSDFRLDGGSNMSNIEEIKAQREIGLRTGLIQMCRYDYPSKKNVNPLIRKLIDGDRVQMIVYGEKVSCDLLILRYPPILQELQHFVPDIEAKRINIIVNQTPMSDYGANGELRYDIKRCDKHIRTYFGKPGVWYPIGPLVREALYQYHREDLQHINLSNEDWPNIINTKEWTRNKRPQRKAAIQIGRHSRSQEVKWPSDPLELLEIYPESKKYEVHVLGGAEAPKKVLGYIPSNWHVLDFGKIPPKEFLKQLDVFVYYTHPNWVESFGRVIIEAMAAGVPVIIPPNYKELFGDAAIYAEPSKVQENIERLINNNELYNAQVEKALKYVENHFGYARHKARLDELNVKREKGGVTC